MSLRECTRQQPPTRIWTTAITASTSIGLIDALVNSGLYGSKVLIDGTLASAGLLVIQLGALVLLLAVAGLIHVLFAGQILGKQGFPKFILLLVVLTLLANLTYLDFASMAFGNPDVAAPKSAIGLLAISAITLLVVAARRLFERRSWTTLRSVLANEHFVLAMPFAIGTVLVVFSRPDIAMAEVSWHRPVALPIIVLLTLAAFLPIKRRWASIGKSVTIAAGCFGVVLAPFAVQWSRVYDAMRPHTPEEAPQHVLLVTVDTLRSDALSCFGSRENRTPAIDELADQSVVFTGAVSPSTWTAPAVSSILTGLSPLTHQVALLGAIDERCTTIAEVFAANGYFTAAIGNNPLIRPGHHNFEQGFHQYRSFPRKEFERVSYGVRLVQHFFPKTWPADASTAGLTSQAIKWSECRWLLASRSGASHGGRNSGPANPLPDTPPLCSWC